MAIEVFNRCEKKYMLNKTQYEDMIRLISKHMECDEYNKGGERYKICNVYYDTDDNNLIRKSIDKPLYKEKLRVRSYGNVSASDFVYVEIKKKYKGVVNKRRTSMAFGDAVKYLSGEKNKDEIIKDNPNINRQVLEEIEYFKRVNPVKPKVYLSYERMAYFAKDDKDFRVTFDTNIRTGRTHLSLELDKEQSSDSEFTTPILPDNVYLCEVKALGAVPMWFASILSELKIYPASFSKYGTEYMIYKGEEKCSNQFTHKQQITQLVLANRLLELA